MQAKIETLKAKDAQSNEYLLYPRTLTEGITSADGKTLEEVVQKVKVDEATTATYDSAGNIISDTHTNLKKQINKIVEGSTTVGSATNSTYLGGVAATEWQTKINTEKSRIDQLVVMQEESIVTDAEKELADIRVGVDGTSYDGAGIAVREQFSVRNVMATTPTGFSQVKVPLDELIKTIDTNGDAALAAIEAKGAETLASIPEDYTTLSNEVTGVKSDLSNFTIQQNLFDESTLTVGGYYFSDGTIAQNADSYYSEQYIEVEPNVEYTFTQSLWTKLVYCTYDANKQLVARHNDTPKSGVLTFADGVKYIRVSFYQNDGVGFKFAKTADFENITDEYGKLIDGMKIVNAPFEKVITEDILIDSFNEHSSFVTCGGNYYPGLDGTKAESTAWHWFEFVAPCDFEMWAESDVTESRDILLAVYKANEARPLNFITRLRKDDTTDTLPTSEAKLTIAKGQLVVISTWLVKDFTFCAERLTFSEKKFVDGISLNEEQIAQTKENNISVFVDETAYRINLNGYTVNLLRDDNEDTRAHLWNIRGIKKDGVVIVPQGTDIVGVLQEIGETDFMGGLHGDETNVEFHILADGKPITENCSCKQLDILMYSHLTRVSTGENVIDRYVHIVMHDNYIEVDTTFKCLVDGFNLSFAYNGGMLAWYDSMADFAMCNTGIINSDGGTSYKRMDYGTDIYHATALIGNSVVTCENLIGHEKETYLGEICYYGNEAEPRIKMYFSTDNNSVWQNGHICKGKARYTFN